MPETSGFVDEEFEIVIQDFPEVLCPKFGQRQAAYYFACLVPQASGDP